MWPFIENLVLTEWIWSITTVSWYLPINIILLLLLFRLWSNFGWVRVLSLSILLSVGSFLVFFAAVDFIGIRLLGFTFILPEDTYNGTYNILNSSLILAVIYSAIQALLLVIIDKVTSMRYWTALLCVITANVVTALLVYKLAFSL